MVRLASGRPAGLAVCFALVSSLLTPVVAQQLQPGPALKLMDLGGPTFGETFVYESTPNPVWLKPTFYTNINTAFTSTSLPNGVVYDVSGCEPGLGCGFNLVLWDTYGGLSANVQAPLPPSSLAVLVFEDDYPLNFSTQSANNSGVHFVDVGMENIKISSQSVGTGTTVHVHTANFTNPYDILYVIVDNASGAAPITICVQNGAVVPCNTPPATTP